jgi:hypothetical protein
MDTTILAKQLGKSAFAKANALNRSERLRERLVFAHLVHQTDRYVKSKKTPEVDEALRKYLEVIKQESLSDEAIGDLLELLRERVEDLQKKLGKMPGNFSLLRKHTVFTEVLEVLEKRYAINLPAKNSTEAPKPKLIWNDRQNALTDLFRKLKNLNNSTDTGKLLPDSYLKIARIMIASFNVFEEISETDLSTRLSRSDNDPQKGKLEIKWVY